jgi:two-component system CheB/CheR fusion protein
MPASAEGQACRNRGPRRVLIADDDTDVAESFAVLLRLEGHDCTFTDDAHTALRLFDELKPDVVLLDIGMPGCNGLEMARRIRASANEANVLLIAVTGWAREADRLRSHEAGFDHHLIKPVDYDCLVELLRPRVQGRRVG